MDPKYLYTALVLYVIYVVYVGFIGAKRIKGLSDFSIAGEKLGAVPVGLAFTATFFSAATFLGYVGYAYAWGWCSLWIFVAIFGGSTLGMILITKGVRERNIEVRALSLPDWLGTMYKSDALRALVAFLVLFQVFYVAGQLSAGGTLLRGLMGIRYESGVWIITIVTVLYVTLGGLFADVYTSIGQTIIIRNKSSLLLALNRSPIHPLTSEKTRLVSVLLR